MTQDAIELRDIRTFLTLAEELHFGRAAERLGISPSRASQTIKLLEIRVGGRLFDRTSRSVRLTPLGAETLRVMRPAYDGLLSALSTTRGLTSGAAGTVRLGMYTVINGGRHMVEIVKAFQRRYPDCRVTMIDTGIERDQFEQLRANEVDVLAARLPINRPEITVGPVLSSEPRVLAMARDHPLAARDSVEWEDVAPYVVSDAPGLPREMRDAFVPPRTPSGVPLRRFGHTSFDAMIYQVALGTVVHPTVASFSDHYRHPHVVYRPIRDLPESVSALVWLTAKATPKLEAFVRVATEILPAPVASPWTGFAHADVRRRAGDAGSWSASG